MGAWEAVLGVLAGLLVLWLGLVAVLLVAGRKYRRPGVLEVLRLLPDLLRLVRRLASDRSVPRAARIRLWLLLAYLVSPIDLIPDAIPVLGLADDAIVVALVLRSVVHRAGREAVARHWPGSPEGLDIVLRAAGITTPAP